MEKKDVWNESIQRICEIKTKIFPININGEIYYDFFELGLNNADLIIIIKKYGGLDLYYWLIEQINLFDIGRLEISKIKKLQILGIIKPQEQFNEEDILIYKKYFGNIQIPDVHYKKVHELPLEKQMFIIKKYIDKYYFRKNNQLFSLEDYIQECLISLSKTRQNFKGTRDYKQSVEYNIKSHLSRTLIFDESKFERDKSYNLEDYMILKDMKKEMLVLLNQLPTRLCMVLRYYYYNKMSYEEIGKELGVTRERIRQLHDEGIEKLKKFFIIQKYILKSQEYKYTETERKLIHALGNFYLNVGDEGIKKEILNGIELLKRYFQYRYESNQNYRSLLKTLDYLLWKISELEKVMHGETLLKQIELTPELLKRITFIRADILANINNQKCKKMGTIY